MRKTPILNLHSMLRMCLSSDRSPASETVSLLLCNCLQMLLTAGGRCGAFSIILSFSVRVFLHFWRHNKPKSAPVSSSKPWWQTSPPGRLSSLLFCLPSS